jgi:hypothetical protein
MKNTLYLIVIIIGCFSNKAQAQGLAIQPSRVVFEEGQIKTTIELINTGSEIKTYTISFVQKSMDENGAFTEITTPGLDQMFSDKLLRIYPRSVTLNPGEGQIVMLQRKRNITLNDGEYRSHLFFRATEGNAPLAAREENTDSESIGVTITPIFGFSIPIIIRSGNIHVKTTLTDLKIADINSPTLSFTVNREGNVSTFGDLLVEYLSDNGERYTLANLRGISVYTTTKKRFISLKLQNNDNLDLTKGSLKLIYIKRDNNNITEEIFGTATLLL